MKILFLENHSVFAQQVISQFLSNHRVTVVPSIKLALGQIAQNEFDLVLCDYDLDDGKGSEFVVKCREAKPQLPIIAVSSHQEGNAALRNAGATDVCSKMDFANICGVIERVLNPKRNSLFARLAPGELNQNGISENAVDCSRIDDSLADDIIHCLESADESDVSFALWFAEILVRRPEFRKKAEIALPEIAKFARAFTEHRNPQLREAAIRTCVEYREFIPDYIAIMKQLLGSNDSISRHAALHASPTFLSSADACLLLPFREDAEAHETLGMGGPLRYSTRDDALRAAEIITGKNFENGDCFHRAGDSTISWRSWSRFNQWLEKRKT